MTMYKLVSTGIGIKTATYLRLMYFIYADDDETYGVVHIVVFGMN